MFFDSTAAARLLAATAALRAQGYVTEDKIITEREEAGQLPPKYIYPLEGHALDNSDDNPFGEFQNDSRVVLSWAGNARDVMTAFEAQGFHVTWEGTPEDTIWVWREKRQSRGQ
jgi:hypothetical protein